MESALVYRREFTHSKTVNGVIGAAFFIMAGVFGAYIRIPVPGTPVPITLQTFFVVLSGAVLGKKLGLISQAGYLFLGLAGLPVFQGYGAGMAHVFGPTGGYLLGFMAASYMTGLITEKTSTTGLAGMIFSFAAGNIILYSMGVAWLMLIFGISFSNAIAIGVLPFIAVEIVKVLVAAVTYRAIADRAKSVFS